MNIRMSLLLVAAVSIFATSCKKEEDNNSPSKPELNIPTEYVSVDYTANTIADTDLKSQLSGLSSYMKSAENGTTKLDITTLKDKFANSGNPSLKSITGTDYASRVENDWFPVLVNASGNAYDPANGASAQNGGVYSGRLFDKGGKENLQEIEKGLYGAALFNRLVTLSEGTINQATIDKMISIIGASPAFPNTNTAANTSSPDTYVALYMARRDKNDGDGFYGQMKKNFIKLQAAVKAGADYTAEKDAALAAIKENIEKGIVATAINYGYACITKLSSTNPPASTIAGGLHDISEGIGFIHGLKAIPQKHRKITDSQIEEILTLLNAPVQGNSTIYKFVTDGATELQKITQAQQKLKTIYGFTDTQMEDFKQNWISAQGR